MQCASFSFLECVLIILWGGNAPTYPQFLNMCHGVGKKKHVVCCQFSKLPVIDWLLLIFLLSTHHLWFGLEFLRAAWWEKAAKWDTVPFFFLIGTTGAYCSNLSFLCSVFALSHFPWIMYHGYVYLAAIEKLFYFLSCDNSNYAASIVESIAFFPLRDLQLSWLSGFCRSTSGEMT